MKKQSVLLISFFLASCNYNHESLKIITPVGAPALAFYTQVENPNFQTNSTPSNIVAMMNNSSEYDIVVIDTVSGLKAIENGAPFKIAATLTHGNFFIAGTGNDDNKIMDKDDVIVLFGQNQTPDLLFKHIYGEGYNLEYVTNIQDASKCLASGKNIISKSEVDYVFMAQPALYSVLNNKEALTYKKSYIYSDIQKEYYKKNDLDIVQASLFVNNNSDRLMVKSFLNELKNGLNDLIKTPEILSDYLNFEDEQISSIYGGNFNASINLIKDNNVLGLYYKDAKDNKDNIDEFIKLFGLNETNKETYF